MVQLRPYLHCSECRQCWILSYYVVHSLSNNC